MGRLQHEIEQALRRKGLSGRQVSMDVSGHDGLIRDLRAGRVPGADRVAALAEALDLEFYFGPRRDSGPVQVIDREAEYAHIPVHDAMLAAGSGVLNGNEEIIDFLAFRRDWLRRIGLDPARAVIARATGESMQPCVWDGDLVLIDRSRTDLPIHPKPERARRAPVFALLDDGQAKIKRAWLVEPSLAMLLSDNPDYAPTFARTDNLSIIGKVVWWGHTSRD